MPKQSKNVEQQPIEPSERLIRVSLRLDSGLEHNMSLPLSTVQDIMNRQTSDFFLEIPVQRYENVNQPIKHRLMHTSRIREIDIFDEV